MKMKTIHLAFVIEGDASIRQLSVQAARMANHLVDNGLVTDELSNTFLDSFSTCVSEDWLKSLASEAGVLLFLWLLAIQKLERFWIRAALRKSDHDVSESKSGLRDR